MINQNHYRTEVLDQLSAIEVELPAEKIIRQIKDLVSSGALRPGERLPSERLLAERLGVGRTHVREALRKLEFYGILRTKPQSGTYVEDISKSGLTGLIGNVLSVAAPSLSAMIEARQVLEVEAARRAAERATPSQLIDLRTALQAHADAAASGRSGMEEDVLFHLALSKAANNEIIHSMTSLLATQAVKAAQANGTCLGDRPIAAAEEHAVILRAVERQEPEAAAHAMMRHLNMTRAQFERPDDRRETS